MRRAVILAIACAGAGLTHWAWCAMDGDPEAQALLKTFRAMPVARTCLDDRLDGAAGGKITGPIGFGSGVKAAQNVGDKAAQFPEDRTEALYVYYGPYVPLRGRFSLDFRLDTLPRDHGFMTIFSIGTAGNTCMTARLGMDLRVTVTSLTRRENVTVFSDPVSLGKWHHFEFWYGPEGAALLLDGVIEDYSTDWSAPYAHDIFNAFYLGDQPWWDADGRKGIFYALDSFVGLIDNLQLVGLQPEVRK